MTRALLRSIAMLTIAALAWACGDSTGSSHTGGPLQVVLMSGAGQQGTAGTALPEPLVVRVLDGSGKPAAGVTLSWSTASGRGSLTAQSAATDAQGLARASWTLGTVAGIDTAIASAGAGSALRMLGTALPGPVEQVGISPGVMDLPGAGAEARFLIRLLDSYGNIIPTPPVAWSAGDALVARVDTGYVRATGPGVTPVRAEVAGRSITGWVVVGGNVATIVETDPVRLRGVPGDTVTVTQIGRARNGYVRDVGVQWTVEGDAVQLEDAGPGSVRVRMVRPGAATLRAYSVSPTRGALGVTDFIVSGPAAMSTVEARYGHTCTLDPAGVAYCWGSNLNDELGTGITDWCVWSYHCTLTPTPVRGGVRFAALTTGASHFCGLGVDGQAYCWGVNLAGQLGIGTSGSSIPITTPTAVQGGHHFAQLAAGPYHTCGIEAGGTLWCWGQNDFGAVGAGTSIVGVKIDLPARVQTEAKFSRVSPGLWYTCGLDLEGRAWCWGSNDWAALGNGSIGPFQSHYDVPAPVLTDLRFTGIWAGTDHTCALTAAGQAYCWGRDWGGGDETPNGYHATPAPVAVGLAFTQLAVGNDFTCGLTAAGAAWCWGSNERVQLGNGAPPGSSRSPVQVAGGLTFRSISAAWEHACGVTTDGKVYCWGSGWALGRGGTSPSSRPRLVSLPT